MFDIKSKIKEWKRVLLVARKPDKEEFSISAKICAIGILIIGLIGFVISVIFTLAGV